MAFNVINNPTPGASTSPHTATGKIGYENLFHSDYIREKWGDMIIEKCYGQYDMVQMLKLIGATGITEDDKEFWTEMGLMRKQQTILSATVAANTAQITIAETEQYYVTKDEIKLPSGKNVRVIAIVSTIPNVISVESVDGSPILITELPAGDKLFHVGNFMEQCYELPFGRRFFPDKRVAIVTTIGENYQYCESEISKPMWNGAYYYFQEQKINQKQHLKNLDNRLIFGQGTTTPMADGAVAGPGMIQQILLDGNVGTYTGAVVEDDIIDWVTQLKENSELKNEYLVLCGSRFLANATKALKDYRLDGCCNGAFTANEGKFAFKLTQFDVNGVIISFRESATFNEPADSSVLGAISYKDSALFLNIGSDDKIKGVELKYKKNAFGVVEKSMTSSRNGHVGMGTGHINRSTNNNCLEEAITTKYMLKMSCLNNHGFLYKV